MYVQSFMTIALSHCLLLQVIVGGTMDGDDWYENLTPLSATR